ncbi:CHC2 zinc finger domain-containing protein [Shinella sumterensis]|uniref:CHC2 zinc finger domain-containing protein n=1 Tax=Shinella sumterensis TaxID=1967501 RepID=UPI003F855A9D
MSAKQDGTTLDNLFERAQIVDIAQRLGLQVDRQKRVPVKAICPFHKDSTPSLNLYEQSSRVDRAHYHCFSCGAHGDVIDLVRGVKGLDFRGAIEWLAEEIGEPIPTADKTRIDKRSATTRLTELLKKPSQKLRNFAKGRGFSEEFLRERGIGVTKLDSLIEAGRHDRVFAEALLEAGFATASQGPQTQSPELIANPLRGFFAGERVVFTIEDERGDPAGLAARSLGEEKPKYLFSRGFSRSSTMYGASAAMKRAAAAPGERQNVFEIYVVEGILDALRLESLGFVSVAILGSQLTKEQANVLGRILKRAEQQWPLRRVNLFLDPDEAGRQGTDKALLELIAIQKENGPFDIEVIIPRSDTNSDKKLDPDTYLRGVTAPDASLLLQSRTDAISALVARRVGQEPASLQLNILPPLERASAARRIVNDVDPIGLTILLDFTPDRPTDDYGWKEFHALVRRYLSIKEGRRPELTVAVGDSSAGKTPTNDAALVRSLELARSTAKRREYPVDEAAFGRLEIASTALYHIHEARLREPSGPREPFAARHVPKANGKVRLKCGPVPEDIVQQQYLLQGLLRTDETAPEIVEVIPAVRFRDGVRRLTGQSGEPLSFAYQVDMDIVDGISPPRREGIFRPYYNCWRDFIGFIADRIVRMPYDTVHILRLDIAGYYDNLRRAHVRDALIKPILSACTLANQAAATNRTFMPLVGSEKTSDPSTLTENILDLISEHSFGFRYRDPENGEVLFSAPDVGIPQGPDLSAYIANVALFELDSIVAEEIALLDDRAKELSGSTDAVGATYARYVDDMVLVCGDGATARRLQRKIETYLSQKGLKLNRKSDPPPPMTKAEARGWVTENRSAVGFSGPLDEIAAQAFFDPLSDAGDIAPDRKFALGLLHDAGLNAPAIYARSGLEENEPRNRALKTIETALTASDLRHNDRVKAYGYLWRIALADRDDVGAIATRFCELVEAHEPNDLESYSAYYRACAALDAVESLLRLSPAIDDATTLEMRQQLILRDKMAALDIVSLVDNAADVLFSKTENPITVAEKFLGRYDIVLQKTTILTAALGHVGLHADGNGRALQHGGRAIVRGRQPTELGSIWASLRHFTPQLTWPKTELPEDATDRDADAFRAMHWNIAEWQRWAASNDADFMPEELSFAPSILNAGTRFLIAAQKIQEIWTSADEAVGTQERDETAVSAAIALININLSRLACLLERRPNLMVLMLGDHNENSLGRYRSVLPRPPGITSSESLFRREKHFIHVALGQAIDQPPSLWGLDFKKDRSINVAGTAIIRIREAELPDGFRPLLESSVLEASDAEVDPRRLTSMYRSFIKVLPRQRQNDPVLLLSAYSFFVHDRSQHNLNYHLISWTAPREKADDFASLRLGDALVPKAIFRNGASYWRFGWALCDALEHSDNVANPEDTADHPQSHPSQLAHAIVRNSFARLTGMDAFGPGKIPESGLPSRIERALSMLDAFGEAKGSDQWTSESLAVAATVGLVVYADGMMINERVDRPGEPWRPGGLSALLLRSARRGARGAYRASSHWRVGSPPIAGLRRTTSAWLALANRVSYYVEQCPDDVRETASTLVAGCRLLAIHNGLRAFVRDLVKIGGDALISAVENLPIDIDELAKQIGQDAALVENIDATSDAPSPTWKSDLAAEVSSLLKAFYDEIHGKQQGSITPLGWAVLAGSLTHGLSIRTTGETLFSAVRPALIDSNQPVVSAALDRIFPVLLKATDISPSVKKGQADPAQVFRPYTVTSVDEWDAALRALVDLDEAIGIETQEVVLGDDPIRQISSGNSFGVRLPNYGTRELPAYAITRDWLRNEDRNVESILSDGKMLFPVTISRHKTEVVGLSMLSEDLAMSAFGSRREVSTLSQTNISDVDQTGSTSSNLSSIDLDIGTADDYSILPSTEPAANESLSGRPNETGDLDKLLRIQRAAWSQRAERSPRRKRIAFLQWDVAETYSYQTDRSIVDLNERRRERLLEAVLDACRHFQVEGLVLPEYSVTPDTLNWLYSELDKREFPQAVWAGTCRVPAHQKLVLYSEDRSAKLPSPGMRALRVVEAEEYEAPTFERATRGFHTAEPLAAVLACLFRTQRVDSRGTSFSAPDLRSVEVSFRTKRHPSIALDEIIRVDGTEWAPLLANLFWGHMHLESYTAELICAELFLHSSTSNMPGLLNAVHELDQRLRSGSRNSSSSFANKAEIREFLYQEIEAFAKATSFDYQKGELHTDLRRSVLIVPAMTTRSADYHIFGQNQFLASGLITVFANAAKPYGVGGSCVIGPDGWKKLDSKLTPYGEVGPGVYNIHQGEFGPLGEVESALTIVDIDPLHTADQKPRPQYQPRPLQLVAHLPLMFTTEAAKDGRRNKKTEESVAAGLESPPDYPGGERVQRRRHHPLFNDPLPGQMTPAYTRPALTLPEALSAFYKDAFENCENKEYDSGKVRRYLQVLESFADDPYWLSRRRNELLHASHKIPPGAPPPALVDWIYVDDRWMT